MRETRVKPETGNRYGRLTVESLFEINKKRRSARWSCLCDCGARVIVSGTSLRTGHTSSCGCFHKEVVGAINRTHNRSPQKGRANPTYGTWKSMHRRCSSPKDQAFKNYGGRGISVCPRWDSYENFEADMGAMPDGLTLDRINNEKGYSPDNCRWATRAEQNSNKRDNVLVEYEGKTMTVMALSKLLKVQYSTLRYRVRQGWPEKYFGSPPTLTLRGKRKQ